MARFKMLRGKKVDLPTILTDGYTYFCTDTGEIFIDFLDEQGEVARKQVSAETEELKLKLKLKDTVVDTIEDRNSLVTEKGAYEGIQVYVKDDKTTYILKEFGNNESWEPLGSSSDENGNIVSGDRESNKINEAGILNSLEGRNNSIGISMIPSIKGSIYETNTIIVNEYNGLYISPIRFDDFVYYTKIVNNNGVYTYTVYQASPKIITDNKGNYQNDSDDINYDNIVKIEFYNGDILFEFEFTDTEKYDFIISNGESFCFSKGEIILMPDTAMFTGMVDGVNFSYANGYQNTALSSSVHITGDSNIVGARAYQILESNKSESTYTLDSVIGLQTGDIYSIRLSANYDNWGKITDIYPETNTVKVDTFIDKAVTASSSFRIASKPWLGTTNWASYARSSGVLNRVHGDAASADGRSNIITGRYGRASGYLNKTGYAGHVQNRSNTALGIDASGSGRDTVADGERSFTMGYGTVAKAKDQLARGKYNIPDNGQNYADIVGNGKDDNNRSNAYTLDWNGNGWFAGSITTEGIITTSDIELPYLKEIIIKGNTVINEELKESSGSIIQTINIDNSTVIDLSDKNIELSSTLKYNDQLIVNDKKISVIKNIRKLTIDSRFGKYWKQATAKSSSGGRTFSKRFYIDINFAVDNEGNTLLTPEELEIFNKGEMVFFTDSGYSSHFSTYITKQPYTHDRFYLEQSSSEYIRLHIFDTNATNILVSANDESIYHEIGSIEIPEGEYDIRTESIDFYFGIVSPKTIDIRDVNTKEWNNIINQYNYGLDINAIVNLEFSNGISNTILNANVTLEYLTNKLAKIENYIRENQNNNIIDIDNDNNCTFPANVEAKGDIIANDIKLPYLIKEITVDGETTIDRTLKKSSGSIIQNIKVDDIDVFNLSDKNIELSATKKYHDNLVIVNGKISVIKNIRKLTIDSRFGKYWKQATAKSSSGGRTFSKRFYIDINFAVDNEGNTLLTPEELEIFNKGEMVFFTDSGYSSHFSTYITKQPYTHDRFYLEQSSSEYIRLHIFDTNATNILVSANDESIYHEIGSIEIPEGEYDIRTESIDFYFGIVSPKTIDIETLYSEEWKNLMNLYNYDSVVSANAISDFNDEVSEISLNTNVILDNFIDMIADLKTKNYTIDSEMSNDSTNSVQNKVVKRYIDDAINASGKSTVIDDAMSENSTNPVQNKVVKKYIDDSVSNIEISVDTEMSDESTNAVQNKVIKKYIDDLYGSSNNSSNNSSNGGFKLVNLVSDIPEKATSGDSIVVTSDDSNKNGLYLYINSTWNKIAMEATTLIAGDIISGGNA